MIKKIVITLLTLMGVIFLPFAFIIAPIYFMLFPDKINEWNKEEEEIKDLNDFLNDKSFSNNTGMH